MALVIENGWLVDEAECKAAPCSAIQRVNPVSVAPDQWYLQISLIGGDNFFAPGGPYATRDAACATLPDLVNQLQRECR
jgi:hypothetical protein